MTNKVKCSFCNFEFPYNDSQDKQNNELVPMKIRKVVVDPEKNIVPLYAISKDKQRLIGEKFIRFMCSECSKKGKV
jgi:hypothetical protein